ncbi:MAG TPA: hypothetical protein VI485_15315 [Vicinamibacterales bacterium]|nr:hypothetical protein [Vicinamibacterales bacterium]
MRHSGFVDAVVTATAMAVAVLWLAPAVSLTAQQPPQPARGQTPRTPRSVAPVDLTGNWVAVVTEDWRFRMVTPPKGDFASVPLNDEGQKSANAWDPAKDAAAGEQCKAFGAAGLMRLPIRLRVSWQDDTALKLETDNGEQVRLFRFGATAAPASAPQWQGQSAAAWETVPEGQGLAPTGGGGGGGGGGGRGGANQGPQLSGSLKVVTTSMRPGYLRRNGIPYTGQAVLTEFYDRTNEPGGDSWLILTSIVDDPTYLQQPFMTTTHFKREPDGSKWSPRACEITPPVQGR